jgi:hypothetical protein
MHERVTVVERTATAQARARAWLARMVGTSAPAAPQHLAPLTLAAVLGLLAVWRAGILLVSFIFDEAGQVTCGSGVPKPWKYSACWDTQNYQIIASSGYQYTPDGPSNVAFFPLYPLLMRWATDLSPGGGDVRAGVIVGTLAMAAAVVYVFLLVRADLGETIAWRSLAFLLMFPAAFFFSAAYTEPVFLLGIAGSLYYARRGQWLLAGLFGAAASATKLVGVFLIVPIVFEAVAQGALSRRNLRPLFGAALAPCGAIAYFAYLQWRFGDFRIFFEAQENWKRDSFSPSYFMGIERLLGDTETMLRFYPLTVTPIPTTWILVDTTLLLLFIGAGVLLWRYVRASYGAFVLASALFLGLSGNPMGLNRFLAVLFPAFILLALIRSEPIRQAIAIVFVMGLTIETYFFVHSWWAG